MLLVIDVGNTNITLGVFNKDELFGTFRMKTKQPRTSDEYGITLQELVERHGIESSKINAVILASVVPDVMHSLGSAIIKYFGVKPVVVSAGIKTGIRPGPYRRCSRCLHLIWWTGDRGRLRNGNDI